MAAFLGISIKWAKDALPHFQEIGEIIGTLVSGTFFNSHRYIKSNDINFFNNFILKFRKDKINDEKLNDLLDTRGFVSRMVGPYFKFISHSWHVLPLGFLFGLGFDTASEISLLALSSGASQKAISFVGIISLPILFAAGMSLLDTLDGILMTSAYNWAFFNPIRKFITILQYYNYCNIYYRCAINWHC